MFLQGSRPHHAFMLTHGLVKLVGTLPSGRQTIVGLRFPGQWLDASAHLLRTSHPVSAIALVDCGICKIDADRFLAILGSNARAAGLFIENEAVDLHNVGVTLMEFKVLNAEQRLERLLTTLAFALGKESADGKTRRLRLPLSDSDIAELIGISAQHLSTLKVSLHRTRRVQWIDKKLVDLLNVRAMPLSDEGQPNYQDIGYPAGSAFHHQLD